MRKVLVFSTNVEDTTDCRQCKQFLRCKQVDDPIDDERLIICILGWEKRRAFRVTLISDIVIWVTFVVLIIAMTCEFCKSVFLDVQFL